MLAGKIVELREQRATTIGAMEGLHLRAMQESRPLDAEEQNRFETLSGRVEKIDRAIEAVERDEALSATRAKSIHVPGYRLPTASDPTGRSAVGKSDLPAGSAFVRFTMALIAARGDLIQARAIAESTWGKTAIPQVINALQLCAGLGSSVSPELVTKAAVPAGTTTDPAWAAPLVAYRSMASEFLGLIYPSTLLGQIANFRRVPFGVKIPRQTAGASVGWIGEGKPKPVSALAFDSLTIDFAKVTGICVFSEELARFSDPSAEALVSNDLSAAIRSFLDVQFIDPAVVANPTANSPASITNGATSMASTGSTVEAIEADLSALMAQVQPVGLVGAVWIMNERTRLALANKRTASGDGLAWPSLATNGALLGLRVVSSDNVPVSDPGDGSTPTTLIALIQPRGVLLAKDDALMVDASREASIAMSDDGTGTLVSLWQQNLVGVRVETYAYWLRGRDASVAVLTGVTY